MTRDPLTEQKVPRFPVAAWAKRWPYSHGDSELQHHCWAVRDTADSGTARLPCWPTVPVGRALRRHQAEQTSTELVALRPGIPNRPVPGRLRSHFYLRSRAQHNIQSNMKCKIERQRDANKQARTSITREAKRRAFRRLAIVRCRYCGVGLTRHDATGDHVHPVSRGGVNKLKNIVIACGDCNSRKGSMEAGMFRKLLRSGRA